MLEGPRRLRRRRDQDRGAGRSRRVCLARSSPLVSAAITSGLRTRSGSVTVAMRPCTLSPPGRKPVHHSDISHPGTSTTRPSWARRSRSASRAQRAKYPGGLARSAGASARARRPACSRAGGGHGRHRHSRTRASRGTRRRRLPHDPPAGHPLHPRRRRRRNGCGTAPRPNPVCAQCGRQDDGINHVEGIVFHVRADHGSASSRSRADPAPPASP
jgi:hypothetical protein